MTFREKRGLRSPEEREFKRTREEDSEDVFRKSQLPFSLLLRDWSEEVWRKEWEIGRPGEEETNMGYL